MGPSELRSIYMLSHCGSGPPGAYADRWQPIRDCGRPSTRCASADSTRRRVAFASRRRWRALGVDHVDSSASLEGSRHRGLRHPAGSAAARCCTTLGRVEPVGQAFPVYKLGDIDVALPRRESKTGRGHKGFTVEGDPSMPFDEAARRRDFTINAIGWDPLTDEYLDPFDGPRRSRAAVSFAWSIRSRLATTRCGCCAPCSLRRGSS